MVQVRMAIDVPNSLVGEPSSNNGHVNGTSESKIISTSIITYPRINRKLLPIIGLFVFYIGHDALQEEMFRFPGFKFGFFMTIVEVIIMLIGSIFEGDSGIKIVCTSFFTRIKSKGNKQQGTKRKSLSIPVLIRIGWVGLLLALAHGLGNTSLNYSPYPLKVAFKSCKLVPTMALGAFVTGRKHTALQYTAALVMGMGLACLTAADVFSSKQRVPLDQHQEQHISGGTAALKEELGPYIGPILLTISTVFDSIVPNLQEQLLQTVKVKTSEMILVSNMVMLLVLIIWTIYSGELILAWTYCISHRDASLVLFSQGLCAYLGLKSYLAIIREHGGVIGVLMANGRKVLTIMLSFCLFAKPFNERHFVGLVLVFLGVYLGYISKRGSKKDSSDGKKASSPGRKRMSPTKKSETDDQHEHNV